MIFLLFIGIVNFSMGSFGNNGVEEVENTVIQKNITLIKESAKGSIELYDDGDIIAIYSIEGVLKDLPDNVYGYTSKIALYDENGELLKEDDGWPLDFIESYSRKSQTTELAVTSIDDDKNIQIIEYKLYDFDGNIVLDENVTISKGNIEVNHFNKADFEANSNNNDKSIQKEYNNNLIIQDDGNPSWDEMQNW